MPVHASSCLKSVWSLLTCALMFGVHDSARALTMNAAAYGGYEVLSYRDDPTKLTDGAVAAGDAYDQTSFKGPQFGIAAQLGLGLFGEFEPLLSIEVMNSILNKSASSEGYKTEGSFNFTHGTLGVGARMGLSENLSLVAMVGLSQALSNKMSVSKTGITSTDALGNIDYTIQNHKKTNLQLGVSLTPLGNGLTLGADFRVGSGCFECKSSTSANQSRAYLTRSGALSVGWMIGHQRDESLPSKGNTKPGLKRTVPRPSPKKQVPKDFTEEPSDE